jgi:hypothetical protein
LGAEELAVVSRQGTVSHFLFQQGIFDQRQHAVDPHPPRLKGRHFDTIEVTEAESQAVLNILREHDFQDGFKNGRSAGNGAYARKGTTSGAMVANRRKVSF